MCVSTSTYSQKWDRARFWWFSPRCPAHIIYLRWCSTPRAFNDMSIKISGLMCALSSVSSHKWDMTQMWWVCNHCAHKVQSRWQNLENWRRLTYLRECKKRDREREREREREQRKLCEQYLFSHRYFMPQIFRGTCMCVAHINWRKADGLYKVSSSLSRWWRWWWRCNSCYWTSAACKGTHMMLVFDVFDS